jgi:Chaperone of endosialidase
MKFFISHLKSVFICFLFFCLSLALISPASANIGIVVNDRVTSATDNVIYGNNNNGTLGSLMLLQNGGTGHDMLRLSLTGDLTLAAGTGGTGNISTPGYLAATVHSNNICDASGNNCFTPGGGMDTTNDSWTGTTNVYETTGNVGIGTAAPGYQLDIASDAAPNGIATLNLQATGVNGNKEILFNGTQVFTQLSGHPLEINAGGNGATKIFGTAEVSGNIYGDSNVGIGTTNPTAKLFIEAASGNTLSLSRTVTSNNPASADWINWTSVWGPSSGGIRAGGSWAWDTQLYSNQGLSFSGNGYSAAAPNMVINTAGHIGIGTTAPNASYKLDVEGGSVIGVYGGGTTGVYGYGTYGVQGIGGTYGVYGYGTYGVEGYGTSYDFYAASGKPSYFAGDVGINTASPSYNLQVNGTGYINGNVYIGPTMESGGTLNVGNGGGLGIYSYGGSDTGIWGAGNHIGVIGQGALGVLAVGSPAIDAESSVSSPDQYYSSAPGGVAIYANGSTYDFYGAGHIGYFGGNVGIGTTAPSGKLQVSYSTAQYLLYNTNGDLSIFDAEGNGASIESRLGSAWNRPGVYVGGADLNLLSSNGVALGSGGNNTVLYISSSQNVGIGNTTPLAKFVVGAIGQNVSGNLYQFGYGQSKTYTAFTRVGTLAQSNDANSPFALYVSVQGNATDANDVGVIQTGHEGTDNSGVLGLQSEGGSIGVGTHATNGYKMYVNGTVYATSFTPASDGRLKKDIEPLQNSLSKVLALKGVSFDWNTASFPDRNFPAGKQIGFIAQDVQKVVPEVVSTGTDGYEALDYDKLTAVLVEAIKEQQAQIDELKAEVESLKK